MTVLTRIIQERAEYASINRVHHARKSRIMMVEFALLMVVGVGLIANFHKIMTVLLVIIGSP